MLTTRSNGFTTVNYALHIQTSRGDKKEGNMKYLNVILVAINSGFCAVNISQDHAGMAALTGAGAVASIIATWLVIKR